MVSGWGYRATSFLGTALLAGAALLVANHPAVQMFVTTFPPLDQLAASTLPWSDFAVAATTAVAVTLLTFLPLFKPRPRRTLDSLSLTLGRLFVAVVALAAVGYFDYTYKLPRSTLLVFSALLALALPAWFLLIQPRAADGGGGRAIVVGDDLDGLARIVEASDSPVVGYVSPSIWRSRARQAPPVEFTDGGMADERGTDVAWLGGLSRLDEVLLEQNIDTVILSFSRPDRAEFFGALGTCYEYDAAAKVPRAHADAVLVTDPGGDDLVDIDLEPWDWQDRVLKRGFDVLFATAGLLVLSPVMLAIAVLIKAEDGERVLYSQERTAAFGGTFTVRKFRTMRVEDQAVNPTPHGDDSDRITAVGRVLRETHLDEIPQLWSILLGDMSVVGPRAIWTEEERAMEAESISWRRRWFVKPGLTGLAQINRASSTDVEAKLRYDIEYIHSQSFWFDLKIVVRQLWMVGARVVAVARGRERNSDT